MTNIQKTFLALFVAFLVAIPLWLYVAVPELEKLPRDYEFKADLFGIEKDSYEIGGEFEAEFIYKGLRSDKISRVEENTLIIEGIFDAKTLDGTELFKSEGEYGIDRVTRQNVKGYGSEDRDGYFIFPQKIEKRSYDLWFPMYVAKIKLDFQSEDVVEGLDTYYFKGQAEKVNDTDGYAFLDLIPEQYIAYTDSVIEMWVEPTTGTLVDYKDDGISYYADKVNGRNVHTFSDWSNTWSDDTIANQVRIAQNKKQEIILYERWIPILFALLSLAFLVALFASRKVALSTSNV
jgi:hypothetical protein